MAILFEFAAACSFVGCIRMILADEPVGAAFFGICLGFSAAGFGSAIGSAIGVL